MSYINLFFIFFSVTGLVLIVGLKILEIKTGKPKVLAWLSDIVDPIMRQKLDIGRRVVGHANATNTRKILGFVAVQLFHVFGTVGVFVSRYYNRSMQWIKGRKKIKGGGVVSFFLKNVAESKEDSEKL